MKIILMGSHGTGKTSLAEELTRRFPNMKCVEGPNRDFKDAFDKLGIVGESKQLLVNQILLFLYKNLGDSFVATRSPYDLIAYSHYVGGEGLLDSTEQYLRDEFCEKDYVYCFVPVEIPLIRDGVRPGDIEFQQYIDREMREMFDRLKESGCMCLEVTGSVEERASQIERYLISKNL